MLPDDVNPRAYRSPLRTEQARQTRLRVIRAARDLLLARGYAGVTMADVAAEAGVSVPLLYKAFGPKPALVKQVYDATLAGDDDDRSFAERPGVAEIVTDPDPRSKLMRYARMGRSMAERAGPLAAVLRAGARVGNSELRPFLETTQREALIGVGMMLRHLGEAGALRPGLDLERARDLVWLAIAPEVFELLVLDRGWSPDAYETWLADTLCATLLP